MPQLDTSTYLSQFFWLAVSFSSLWFVMAWFIIPKIEDILEQRRKKIDDYIQKAEKINKQALMSLEKYKKAIAKARHEAELSLDENKAAMAKIIEDKHAEIDSILNQKIAENEFVLAKERQETMVTIDNISAAIAAEILNKLEISSISAQELQNSFHKDS